MSQKFSVEITNFKPISEIAYAWSSNDYTKLLEAMGINEGLEDLSEKDLKEMCLMSLGDLEHHEAGKVVLSYLFADEDITEGKIDQLSHELSDDKMWEQFSDLHFHHRLFNAYSLLRSAYNGIFSQPTGVELTLKIKAENEDDLEIFDTSLKPALTRLIAGGMSENAILNRLYGDQISGTIFQEAEDIIWILEVLSRSETSCELKITSSSFWLDGLSEVTGFEAQSHADSTQEAD